MNKVKIEGMREYVKRKLTEKSTNLSGVSIDTGINRQTIYSLLKGREVAYTTIEKLEVYFNKAAD